MNGSDKVSEKMEKILIQKPARIELFPMGMMNEIPISSKGPKGCNTLFLQDAERNAAYFGELQLGYFMHIVPGSENIWNFEKYPDNVKRQMGSTSQTSYECVWCTAAIFRERMYQFSERVLKKDGENMHFDSSDPFKKMMMDLVSSANDICVVFGICDHLGKVNDIDPESQRNTVSVVLPPRIPETFNLLDNMQLKIPPVMLRQRKGTSQQEHHFLRMLGIEEDWRQRDTSSYFRIMKHLGQLSKERTNLQKKNLFDCVKLQITQKSWRLVNSFRQNLQETALQSSAYLVEKLTDPPLLKVYNYYEESDLEAELGRSKK